jgi:hypothetical protein
MAIPTKLAYAAVERRPCPSAIFEGTDTADFRMCAASPNNSDFGKLSVNR